MVFEFFGCSHGAEHCGNMIRRDIIKRGCIGNLAVVKRRHYILEMSQNYVCFIQLHC
jgi:hypothetical protein